MKRAWNFRCKDGKGGTIIFPDPVDSKIALEECRLSLGLKVLNVY